MQVRAWIVCALVLGPVGCGSDGDGGVGALFEALNGDYEIREESDCVIAIRGSRFETRTSMGQTTCSETYTHSDGTEGETEVLRVSGSLSDMGISGTLFNEESYPFSIDSDCPSREGRRVEITASADKTADRSADGRFEGLAGTWEGEVEIVEYGFFEPCDGPEEKYEAETSTYTFTANVNGDDLTVTYENNGDVDAFQVNSTSSGDLIIEGEVVSFESE